MIPLGSGDVTELKNNRINLIFACFLKTVVDVVYKIA